MNNGSQEIEAPEQNITGEEEKMKTITLELDYLIGPIMKDIYDESLNQLITDIPVIDNDYVLNELNSEISNLYSDCYEFDSHDKGCYFNKENLRANKETLIKLMDKLNKRLNEINDGSFNVKDLATPFLESIK